MFPRAEGLGTTGWGKLGGLYDGQGLMVVAVYKRGAREVERRLVALWCDIPCAPKTLRRGVERRAFLSDPTPHHGLHFTSKHGS